MIWRCRVLDRMFWDRMNKINGIGLFVAAVYDQLRDRMIRQAKFALSPATSYPLLVTSGPVARRRSQTALFGKIIGSKILGTTDGQDLHGLA